MFKNILAREMNIKDREEELKELVKKLESLIVPYMDSHEEIDTNHGVWGSDGVHVIPITTDGSRIPLCENDSWTHVNFINAFPEIVQYVEETMQKHHNYLTDAVDKAKSIL
jgi:hypothetical protein